MMRKNRKLPTKSQKQEGMQGNTLIAGSNVFQSLGEIGYEITGESQGETDRIRIYEMMEKI